MTTPISQPTGMKHPGDRVALPDAVARACKKQLQHLREVEPGISSVGLVGPDGFEVASVGPKRIPITKIAALTSTMVSVAQAFVREIDLPPCRDLILDTDIGCAVFMAVTSRRGVYALFAIAEDNAPVGRVLARARLSVQELKSLLSSDEPQGNGGPQ